MTRASDTPRLLSLASGVLPEFSPQEAARAAAQAGWEAVGLWVDPTTWTSATTREVRALLADGALACLDVEVIWLRPGADDPDHFRLLDVGAELGARNALVVSSEPDLAVTAEKLGRLVDHAGPVGLRVSLEFGAFTAVRALGDALRVLELCGRPGAGLLVDPLHFARTGSAPSDLAAVDPTRFAYAQFCDAPAAGPSPDEVPAIIAEALDGRLLPGDGDLPLSALLDALPPAIPLSVELRSKALREAWPQAASRARALLAATTAMLDTPPA